MTVPIADERSGDAFAKALTLSVESVLRVRTTSMISRSFAFAEITLAFMFVAVNVCCSWFLMRTMNVLVWSDGVVRGKEIL